MTGEYRMPDYGQIQKVMPNSREDNYQSLQIEQDNNVYASAPPITLENQRESVIMKQEQEFIQQEREFARQDGEMAQMQIGPAGNDPIQDNFNSMSQPRQHSSG